MKTAMRMKTRLRTKKARILVSTTASMPKLFSPIPRQYLKYGYLLIINQLFGYNKNGILQDGKVVYGPKGHTGLDIRTARAYQYLPVNQVWDSEKGFFRGHVKETLRDKNQADGRIPLLACMEGNIEYILQENKERNGWGVYTTALETKEGNEIVQYRTLHFHIEGPTRGLKYFEYKPDSIWKSIAAMITGQRTWVKVGEIIAFGGNNGMSSGPHLHLELQKRTKVKGKWTAYESIDPLPHLTGESDLAVADNEDREYATYWYRGKPISEVEYKLLTKDWPTVIRV